MPTLALETETRPDSACAGWPWCRQPRLPGQAGCKSHQVSYDKVAGELRFKRKPKEKPAPAPAPVVVRKEPVRDYPLEIATFVHERGGAKLAELAKALGIGVRTASRHAQVAKRERWIEIKPGSARGFSPGPVAPEGVVTNSRPTESEAQIAAVAAFVNEKGRTTAEELGVHLGVSVWVAGERARTAVARGLIVSRRGRPAGYFPSAKQAA